jgi:hypothetical protein
MPSPARRSAVPWWSLALVRILGGRRVRLSRSPAKGRRSTWLADGEGLAWAGRGSRRRRPSSGRSFAYASAQLGDDKSRFPQGVENPIGVQGQWLGGQLSVSGLSRRRSSPRSDLSRDSSLLRALEVAPSAPAAQLKKQHLRPRRSAHLPSKLNPHMPNAPSKVT